MVIKTPSYSPGAPVQTRERKWVVLPANEEAAVRLKAVDDSDEDCWLVSPTVDQVALTVRPERLPTALFNR